MCKSQNINPISPTAKFTLGIIQIIIKSLSTSFNKIEFRESDVSPGKTEVKQGKFVKFISPTKSYFREMCKSQNINHISPTAKFTLGIIQIIIKSLSTSFNKIEFRESDVSPGKTEVKQGKFVKFISPTKSYFREMCKSQNINHISPTAKFTLGIIQIIIKSLSTSFNKIEFRESDVSPGKTEVKQGKGALTRYGKLTWVSAHTWNLIILR